MAATGTLTRRTDVPAVSFEHLYRMSDSVGLFEHAKLSEPRREHAYCVDDVARGLVVAMRVGRPTAALIALTDVYLRFVLEAQTAEGLLHNRRALDRRWEDEAGVEDCWGRALWGLGATVAGGPAPARDSQRARALAGFELSAARRSPDSRSMAFGALGAADVLSVLPDHGGAQALLADAADRICSGGDPAGWRDIYADRSWVWPEARLRYANAALAEALLAAGSMLGDARHLDDGLAMLAWLLDVESDSGHLSVTPVGGWESGQPRPGFDQQPIEVAALADACARAFDITGQGHWKAAVLRCRDWFLGDNDCSVPLHDPVTEGGCDGLMYDGRNENQGAESTLAMISTFQQAARLASV